jgi:hypothetical protein
MFGGHVEVRGPYSAQPSLVKAGCVAAFVAFVVFGSYIPTSTAVAVIVGVGKPAAHWTGTAGALALIAAMAAVGIWTNCRFLCWLRGGDLGFRAGCVFASACILGSAAVAFGSAALHLFSAIFLGALAAVVVGLLASWVLISVGQATNN